MRECADHPLGELVGVVLGASGTVVAVTPLLSWARGLGGSHVALASPPSVHSAGCSWWQVPLGARTQTLVSCAGQTGARGSGLPRGRPRGGDSSARRVAWM